MEVFITFLPHLFVLFIFAWLWFGPSLMRRLKEIIHNSNWKKAEGEWKEILRHFPVLAETNIVDISFRDGRKWNVCVWELYMTEAGRPYTKISRPVPSTYTYINWEECYLLKDFRREVVKIEKGVKEGYY